jgi:hypothetical protein
MMGRGYSGFIIAMEENTKTHMFLAISPFITYFFTDLNCIFILGVEKGQRNQFTSGQLESKY